MAQRKAARSPRVADAAPHKRTREDHSAETAEDYVEAIADSIDQSGSCRVVDLTKVFGVSHVTVSRTVDRLVKAGLASTEPYRPISLTPEGRKLAEKARRRHETVRQFLIALGVDEKTAAIDAEGIEHHVSPRTLEAFERFVRKRGRTS